MYFCWLNDQQATHQMFILESEKRFYCTFVWFVDWSRLMSLSAQCPKVRFQCSTVIMSHLPFYLFLFFQLPKFLLWWFEILLSYDHNKMRNVTHDTVHEECVCVCLHMSVYVCVFVFWFYCNFRAMIDCCNHLYAIWAQTPMHTMIKD